VSRRPVILIEIKRAKTGGVYNTKSKDCCFGYFAFSRQKPKTSADKALRHWKDHFKNVFRSDLDLDLKNDLRSDIDHRRFSVITYMTF
jgi:hypothetical protein